jgi:hypothetical protein
MRLVIAPGQLNRLSEVWEGTLQVAVYVKLLAQPPMQKAEVAANRGVPGLKRRRCFHGRERFRDSAHVLENQGQITVDASLLRPEADGGVTCCECLGQFLLPAEDDTEIILGIDVGWIDCDGLAEQVRGFLEPVLLKKPDALGHKLLRTMRIGRLRENQTARNQCEDRHPGD